MLRIGKTPFRIFCAIIVFGFLGLFLPYYCTQHRIVGDIVPLLRDALKRNNEENIGELRDRFLSGAVVRRVGTINSSTFFASISSSEPLIVSNPPRLTSSRWTVEHIRRVAGGNRIGIETSTSNRFYSNSALQKERMLVRDFLDVFTSAQRKKDYYLAEEDISQLPGLEPELKDPPFAEFSQVDKRQLWIGAGGQVSPLHHDQWDNVLLQIQGTRTITLFDPLEVPNLYPKPGLDRHFSYVDAESPDLFRFPKFANVRKYEVVLHAGELLVLPAFWWHQVRHDDSVNVAVNFWYVPSSILAEMLYDILLPPGPNN